MHKTTVLAKHGLSQVVEYSNHLLRYGWEITKVLLVDDADAKREPADDFYENLGKYLIFCQRCPEFPEHLKNRKNRPHWYPCEY